MFKFFRRTEPVGVPSTHRAPPALNPIEIGLSLRSARERERLSLQDVRERTDVPVVDLDALERGRLELFHVEQAAVIGLWRYAEVLGLEPDNMVTVLHEYWPTPALSNDAMGSVRGVPSTPIAQLAMATSLLSPIVSPRELTASAKSLGLSKSMQTVLSTASLGASRAVASIGPGRPSKSGGKKKAELSAKSDSGNKKSDAKSDSKLDSKPDAKAPKVQKDDEGSTESSSKKASVAKVTESIPPAPSLQSPMTITSSVVTESVPTATAGDNASEEDRGVMRAARTIGERFGVDWTKRRS